MLDDLRCVGSLHCRVKMIQINFITIANQKKLNLQPQHQYKDIVDRSNCFVTFKYHLQNSSQMENHILVTKPHYCNRFTVPQKIANKHECSSPALSPSRVNSPLQNLAPHHTQSNSIQAKQIKMFLLEAFKQSKLRWEQWLSTKQTWIKTFKREHKSLMEKVLKQIEELRKKAYEQYKHICSCRKDNPCFTCNKLNQYIKLVINQYLSPTQTPQKEGENNKKLKRKYGKSNTNNSQQTTSPNQYEQTSAMRDTRPMNGLTSDGIQPEEIIIGQNANVGTTDQNSLNPTTDTLNTYKYNRKNEKLLTSLQRPMNKSKSNAFLRDSSNRNPSDETYLRGLKSKNSMFKQSSKTLKTQQTEDDQNMEKNINDVISEESLNQNTSRASTTRKSVLKYPSATGELQNGNARSKFMPLQTDNEKDEQNAIRSNKRSPTGKRSGGKSPHSVSPLSSRRQLAKSKKKGEAKKKAKVQDDQQILIDIDEAQSLQTQKEASDIEEVEIMREYANAEKRQYRKQEQNAKLSRYRREKLFYTILKRQLADHLSSPPEEEEEQEEENAKPQEITTTLLNSSQYEPGSSSKYSILERKQSLISKLNIFKQTSNFEDIKLKIEAVLENKDEFILRNAAKELIVSETVEKTDDAKQKILEMFLADVLKVNDLKRLLKNKFSKERHWGQQMRQMHQFYTYLQYSLQNFRNNLNNTIENNWREITEEGNKADFDIDELVIDQDMGHYQGLENVELNQYQHHKEIECSMKYYGIEVKKIEQLRQFRYLEPFDLPGLPSTNVVQKSLKEIQETPEEQLMSRQISPRTNRK